MIAEPEVDVVAALESQTFALLPWPADAMDLLADFYVVWEAFFTSSHKFAEPGSSRGPNGYLPLCFNGGCEMKESYYVQADRKVPRSTLGPTHRLMALLSELVHESVVQLARAEGWPRDLLVQSSRGCLRVMRYPPFEGEAVSDLVRLEGRGGAERMVAHTDLNVLSVLPPPTAPGLEIQVDGVWLAAEEPHSGLLHTGQQLEARSGGRWRATTHRVRNPLPEEARIPRLSAAYFVS